MIEFEELQKTIKTIKKAIAVGNEPINDYRTISVFLDDLCANNGTALVPVEPKDPQSNEEQKDGLTEPQIQFILEDMTPDIIKMICRESSKDSEYLAVIGGVLERFLNLMHIELKRGHFNQMFLISCRSIFDFDCNLHNLNYQIPDTQLERMFTKASAQTNWREELKEGDMVDAILHHLDGSNTS